MQDNDHDDDLALTVDSEVFCILRCGIGSASNHKNPFPSYEIKQIN